MTIREKTLLGIGATLVGMVFVLSVVFRIMLLNSFSDLDLQDASGNVRRIDSAFQADLDAMNAHYVDWSAWDDCYSFVSDANPAFVASNLTDSTFTSTKSDLMLFVDRGGRIVYGRAFDRNKNRQMPIPSDMKKHLAPGKPLLNHPTIQSRLSGIVSLDEGLMMVISHPILTSEATGPSHGTLIVGRYLGAEEMRQLSQVTHRKLDAYRYGDVHMPRACLEALLDMPRGEHSLVRPLDSDRLAGYLVLDDIYGKPCLIVRTEMDRRIYGQGRRVVACLMVMLVAIGLVFGVLNWFLMEKLVLSKLAILNRMVAGAMRDLGLRHNSGANHPDKAITRKAS